MGSTRKVALAEDGRACAAVDPAVCRPRKEPISIRVDSDVLDWLRQRADHYQTEINTILRSAMVAQTQARRDP